MIRSIISALLLLILCSIATSQPYNTKQYLTKIYDFKADSLKSTPAFPLGDNENLSVHIRVNDTSAAGYINDSINLYYGIQYGSINENYLGQKDTEWVEPTITIDTFRMASGNIKVANTFSTIDSLQPLAICTTYVSGLACHERVITPYRKPIARIRVKGTTGNELTSFLRLQVLVEQAKYTRVNIGQTNQPDD